MKYNTPSNYYFNYYPKNFAGSQPFDKMLLY